MDEGLRCQPNHSNADIYDNVYALYGQLSRALIQSEVFSTHRRLI
jgi:hypothetical protein